MWMKIVGCLILVITLNCTRCDCRSIEYHVGPTKDIKISKNITFYRNGYGRHLGLLSLLKDFRHRKHIYKPYVLSKLWRASFEFELKPHAISENAISSSSYFPTHFGVSSSGATDSGLTNSGVGSNSIDSIFHFGNNEQQSSVAIGGSSQIAKGPDERDEIATNVGEQSEIVHKDAIPPVVSAPPTEEKSERVLRHVIQSRADEPLDEDENTNILSTTANFGDQETANVGDQETANVGDQETANVGDQETANVGDQETDNSQPLTIPETTTTSSATPSIDDRETDNSQSLTLPQTAITSPETLPESAITTMRSESSSAELATTTKRSEAESSSTISNNNAQLSSTSTPLSSDWLGYYDFGIHKPEFIQAIEFTTNYPTQLVNDIRYVTYETPFRPSLPDYTNEYNTNFFVPLRYKKR